MENIKINKFISGAPISVNILPVLDELLQSSKLSACFVRQILASSRLLVDHVECLEQVFYETESNPPNVERLKFTNASCLLMGSFLWNHVVGSRFRAIKSLFTVALGGYGILYAVKVGSKLRNRFTERRLAKLIETISRYETSIKRNVAYFNEIIFIKSSENSILLSKKQYERAWNCIESIKDITMTLFQATRNIERFHPLSQKFADLYAPMEDLNDCDYFREEVSNYNPSNIKDFYNIFTYVQSQFLLRLALSVAQDGNIPFINKELSQLTFLIEGDILQEEESFKKLTMGHNSRTPADLSQLHKGVLRQTQFGPLAVLKDTSLRVNSSITAVANELHQLDDNLQRFSIEDDSILEDSYSKNADEMLNIVDSMRNIEASLSGCCDDFQRLLLTYNKYLESTLHINANLGSTIKSDSCESLENNQLENMISNAETEPAQLDDEFYAYMDDDSETRENKRKQSTGDMDMDFATKQTNLTKKKFRPVLKQLKEKIDPIREEMLLKERNALMKKGIDIGKFLPPENVQDDSEMSDSESEDAMEKIKSRKSKADNYEEFRDFLSQKAPLNLFNIKTPNQNVLGSEEILE